jgi:hypothetical protein
MDRPYSGPPSSSLVLAFVGALYLYKGIDSRLLMAIGFTAITFACLINSVAT